MIGEPGVTINIVVDEVREDSDERCVTHQRKEVIQTEIVVEQHDVDRVAQTPDGVEEEVADLGPLMVELLVVEDFHHIVEVLRGQTAVLRVVGALVPVVEVLRVHNRTNEDENGVETEEHAIELFEVGPDAI